MAAPDPIETRRKRLFWRATHRGIKEMDILLGGFATAHIATLDDADLDRLEAIIALPDQEMLSWATKQAPVPAEHASPLLAAILDFRP